MSKPVLNVILFNTVILSIFLIYHPPAIEERPENDP